MPDTLLHIRDLSSERDDRLLIDRLSLTVSAGDIVQVEGPNGSGKTTLLRILCGLSSRFDGELFWRGQPLAACRSEYRAETLYLGHGAGVKAVLSPRENLRWLMALHNQRPQDSAIEAALEKVGLRGYEDSPCHMLSAGQQRRVSLARLFVTRSVLWVLDEPFTAIDKGGVAEIEQWLVEHSERGGAVILTTHHALSLPRPPLKVSLGQSMEMSMGSER